MDNTKITQGHLCAFVTVFIWGTTNVSTKILLNSFSPTEILFFRMVIAYIALFLLFPHFMKFQSLKEELLLMGAGLCGITLYYTLQNTALAYTLASNVGILISLAPFLTAILSYLFLKDEAPHPNFFIGFVVAIIGVILIGYNGNYVLKLNPLGDFLAILSAVAWACYCVFMKKVSNYHYNTYQCTRKIFVYGTLFLIPILAFSNFKLDLARFTSLTNSFNILFLALCASALCFITWGAAIGTLGAVKTSVYIYVIPVVTAIMAAVVLHEEITTVAIIGMALILAGLYLSERKPKVMESKASVEMDV